MVTCWDQEMKLRLLVSYLLNMLGIVVPSGVLKLAAETILSNDVRNLIGNIRLEGRSRLFKLLLHILVS
jgi:uncharacterized membrane protein YjgN (DUF898 family)